MAERAIFITGGASGIGQAVAVLFAARGWRIGIADVNVAGLEATRAMLPADRVTTHPFDVRDRDGWTAALADFADASGGRLDVLFNNAGIGTSGPFASADPRALEHCNAVNFMGVVHGAHVGFPLLAATPDSAMLITSSAAGIYGTAGAAIYSATKFAVRGLAEALDGEWAAAGVKVRTLMPAFIDTPLLDQPAGGSNQLIRESVQRSGLEISPVSDVAEAAWQAVHGPVLHTRVGSTARKLWFAARWMPGALRKQAQRSRLGRR
ncbi:SDR family oxidoreductase [Sphingomonas sp. HT-1]|uniref:SDR family oxidoreductase n=1 Tax=unclassified Sphingomonas TaxID=196159 RepID=UPI00031766AE|nr:MULTISPECIES: SDR family oxidoreductase [unclassified Sphingomonas]KTF69936.1 short-chain dehydrogenase [Sphingomonas sp. WG]